MSLTAKQLAIIEAQLDEEQVQIQRSTAEVPVRAQCRPPSVPLYPPVGTVELNACTGNARRGAAACIEALACGGRLCNQKKNCQVA